MACGASVGTGVAGGAVGSDADFPEEPEFPVCEVRPELPVMDKLVGNRLRLRSSDAHHLGDILEAVFDLEVDRFSLGGLFDTVAGRL